MTDQNHTEVERVIACDLNAIPADERDGHVNTARQLFLEVEETRVLPDGYLFRLPVDELGMAAAYVTNDRLCCPFFEYTLHIEPYSPILWLSMTGSQEVKRLLGAGLGEYLPEDVARSAGLL